MSLWDSDHAHEVDVSHLVDAETRHRCRYQRDGGNQRPKDRPVKETDIDSDREAGKKQSRGDEQLRQQRVCQYRSEADVSAFENEQVARKTAQCSADAAQGGGQSPQQAQPPMSAIQQQHVHSDNRNDEPAEENRRYDLEAQDPIPEHQHDCEQPQNARGKQTDRIEHHHGGDMGGELTAEPAMREHRTNRISASRGRNHATEQPSAHIAEQDPPNCFGRRTPTPRRSSTQFQAFTVE